MTEPGPIGHGLDAPNRYEEYAAAAGVGLLLANLLPPILGWLGLAAALVSYGVRYYGRHG